MLEDVWYGVRSLILIVSAALVGCAARVPPPTPPVVMCPKGSSAKGADPPRARMLECLRGDERHGPWVAWYESGAKMFDFGFSDGKAHGRHRRWLDDGTLVLDEHFEHGAQAGVRRTWYPDGTLREAWTYEGDQPERGVSYREDGSLDSACVREGGWFICDVFFGASDPKGRFRYHGRVAQAYDPARSTWVPCDADTIDEQSTSVQIGCLMPLVADGMVKWFSGTEVPQR